tara:strand:+ start:2709 stop:3233 length:525 start_codon:yes stop_codon:yes gene_type:complete
MFIAVKNKKIIAIQEVEWMCRRRAKGLDKSAYWTWLETVTTEDENGVKTYDFSGEDYEIVETKVDIQEYHQSGHITTSRERVTSYHLKWDASKKEIVKDDTAKAAWELAEEWKLIRQERNRLLSESDWTQGGDSPLTTQKKSDWAKYRTSLRTLPEDQSSKTKYSDITWPTKPS